MACARLATSAVVPYDRKNTMTVDCGYRQRRALALVMCLALAGCARLGFGSDARPDEPADSAAPDRPRDDSRQDSATSKDSAKIDAPKNDSAKKDSATSKDSAKIDAAKSDGSKKDSSKDSSKSDTGGVPAICGNMIHSQATLAGDPGTNATPVTLPLGTGAVEINRGCAPNCNTLLRRLGPTGQPTGGVSTVLVDMLSDPPVSIGETAIFFSNFMHSSAYLRDFAAGSVNGPIAVADPATLWTGTWFPRAVARSGEIGVFHVSFDNGTIGLFLTRLSSTGAVLEYDRLIKKLTTNGNALQAPGWDGTRYVGLYGGAIVFSDKTPEVPLVLAGGESMVTGSFAGDSFVLFTAKSQVGYATRVGLNGQVQASVQIAAKSSSVQSPSVVRLPDGSYVLGWVSSATSPPTYSLMALSSSFVSVGTTTLSGLSWPVLPTRAVSIVSQELFGAGLVPLPSGFTTSLHLMVSELAVPTNRAATIVAVTFSCP
jgi:hypothetical protein